MLTLTTDSGTIRTTVYHPFWVERGRDLGERSVPRELSPVEDQGFSLEGRWVNSHELRVGDILIGQDGSRRALLRIESRRVRQDAPKQADARHNSGKVRLDAPYWF